MRSETFRAPGLVLTEHELEVPLDHAAPEGERITIFLAEDRSLVEGGQQERVKAVFYPKSQDEAAARPKPVAGQCS